MNRMVVLSSLLLAFLSLASGLRIFSPSSIGMRYFDESQPGVVSDHGIQHAPEISPRRAVNYGRAHSKEWHEKHKVPLPEGYLTKVTSKPFVWPPPSRKPIPRPTESSLFWDNKLPSSAITKKPYTSTVNKNSILVNKWKPITSIFTPSKKPPCSCKCGIKYDAFKVDSTGPQHIIGGKEAILHEYPWIVRLAVQGRTFCGGALINNEYVLTAAHCVANRQKEQIQAIFGDHDQTTTRETIHTVMSPISVMSVHEKYSSQNYSNDIALLKLSRPVSFNMGIQPVCLPGPAMMDPPAKIGQIAGWGRTVEKGKGSNTILKVDVPILSLSECRNKKLRPGRITDEMLCAGEANKDSCQGDSGGPLIVQSSITGKHEVHGVVSWGIGCGRDGYPGIYTRVSKYLDWVKRKMPDTCLCT